MPELVATHYNYWISIFLMMMGLYILYASGNLVKKLVALGIFQTSVFLLYISLSKVIGGRPPVLPYPAYDKANEGYGAEGGADPANSAALAEGVAGEAGVATALDSAASAKAAADAVVYSNPLPHVLILTAIVVGVATLAVGLALVVRIRETYGSIDDVDLDRADIEVATRERGA